MSVSREMDSKKKPTKSTKHNAKINPASKGAKASSHKDLHENINLHPHSETHFNSDLNTKSEAAVKWNFKGRGYFEKSFPEAIEFIDNLANSWKTAEFELIPIQQPQLKAFVSQSLLKAKTLEKKVEEKIRTQKERTSEFKTEAFQKMMNLNQKINEYRASGLQTFEEFKKKIKK